MKIIMILFAAAVVFSLPLLTGCASGSEAGSGTGGSSQAAGGPGNGSNGAMQGTTP